MMENIISVIVPTYNAEKTIEETIKSIVGENIEIIIGKCVNNVHQDL